MTFPAPIHLGQFDPIRSGDKPDTSIDIGPELAAGETVTEVAFTVEDAAGETVPDVITQHTETGTQTDFRIDASELSGRYLLTAVFDSSTGKRITRTADLWIF